MVGSLVGLVVGRLLRIRLVFLHLGLQDLGQMGDEAHGVHEEQSAKQKTARTDYWTTDYHSLGLLGTKPYYRHITT